MNAKQYRLERNEAWQRIAELEQQLKAYEPTSKFTKKEIVNKHDRWLLRLTKKTSLDYDELRQFWLFRDLMFKHWSRFK